MLVFVIMVSAGKKSNAIRKGVLNMISACLKEGVLMKGEKSKIHHCPPGSILYCSLMFFFLALSSVAAQEKTDDQFYPYTLGVGAEASQNTRKWFALDYGAMVDRFIAYREDGRGLLLAGIRGYMITDLKSISGTEAALFLRVNMFRIGPGSIYSQLSWGFSSYREDTIEARTLLADFTIGYRAFFLDGFYVEPYFRSGFPFRMAFGLMAGHRFTF